MTDARVPSRVVRARFPALRDEHLRSLAQWRLVQSAREQGETWYSFADLAVLREVHDALSQGTSLKAIVRQLLATRQGQLTLFDGSAARDEGGRARVVTLAPRPSRADESSSGAPVDTSRAEEAFERATSHRRRPRAVTWGRDGCVPPGARARPVDDGGARQPREHPLRPGSDHRVRSALREGARADPTCFEAHFNLGNVYHDTGRFESAARCYTSALAIDPAYADAHFYLAVTLEKLGRSGEARPHWVAYQRLAPNGEWVELAREFSE